MIVNKKEFKKLWWEAELENELVELAKFYESDVELSLDAKWEDDVTGVFGFGGMWRGTDYILASGQNYDEFCQNSVVFVTDQDGDSVGELSTDYSKACERKVDEMWCELVEQEITKEEKNEIFSTLSSVYRPN